MTAQSRKCRRSWLVFHWNCTCLNSPQADGTASACILTSELQEMVDNNAGDDSQDIDDIKGVSATMYAAGVDTVSNLLNI